MMTKEGHEKARVRPKAAYNVWTVLLAFVLVIIVIGSLIGANNNAEENNKEIANSPSQKEKTETVKKEIQKVDESLLNATVKKSYDVLGIEITNNENVNWDSCKLVLNGEYERTINNPLEPNSPLNNPYGLFAKPDGTRFNYSTTTPQSILIDCRVNGTSRNNYYTF